LNKLIERLMTRQNAVQLSRCGEAPSDEHLARLMELFRTIAFPGFVIEHPERKEDLSQLLTGAVAQFRGQLISLACWTLQQTRKKNKIAAADLVSEAQRQIDIVLELLPDLIELLHQDVEAACNGDPACIGPQEVVICYPGFRAVMLHRLSHELYKSGLRLMARMLSEWAHSTTGIDIHPGATIGHHFFIDHGTGVVIGETSHVGNHVKIYQGVTLGAVSFSKDESGKIVREDKRHPTLEDHVVIYAGATVLGGTTVIGHHSVIGGSVWLVNSVAPYSTVVMEKPRLRIRNKNESSEAMVVDYQI
jgi:serine O-acetyltransferase